VVDNWCPQDSNCATSISVCELAFEILPSQYDTYFTTDGPHGEFSCQVFYEEKRVELLMEYFAQYNAQYLNSPNPNAPLIPFNPPLRQLLMESKPCGAQEKLTLANHHLSSP
jgi:hypothetical protein